MPEDRKEAVQKVSKCFLDALPKGFQEVMRYGMLDCVVPYSIFLKGCHCNSKLPLGFINIASKITVEEWIQCYENILKRKG